MLGLLGLSDTKVGPHLRYQAKRVLGFFWILEIQLSNKKVRLVDISEVFPMKNVNGIKVNHIYRDCHTRPGL